MEFNKKSNQNNETVELNDSLAPYIVSDMFLHSAPLTSEDSDREVLTRRACIYNIFENDLDMALFGAASILLDELQREMDYPLNYNKIRKMIMHDIKQRYAFIYSIFNYNEYAPNDMMLISNRYFADIGLSMALSAYNIVYIEASEFVDLVYRPIIPVGPFKRYNMNIAKTLDFMKAKANNLYIPAGIVFEDDDQKQD